MRYLLHLTIRLLPILAMNQSMQGQVQEPKSFFPSYQERFIRHDELVDYAQHLASYCKKAHFIPYGSSVEGRPLFVVVFSEAEDSTQLEQVRKDHRNYLTQSGKQLSSTTEGKVIIWISHGVHGNEAGATHSSIETLYALYKAYTDTVRVDEFRQAIVVIDPCLNPDGYERYTQFYHSRVGTKADDWPFTAEHQEPWPGGRVNHYCFDLNRDWAWQTQKETVQRMKLYFSWLPQVHVDVHEQFPESPYYFAPAARPYHKEIQEWQVNLQDSFGRAISSAFDAHGWRYFTKEVFDLFYPSYGDTYPIFTGAIGMTFEQAGHGIAGLSYRLENGKTLHLSDRVAHHHTAVFTTIIEAIRHKQDLRRYQRDFFQDRSSSYTGYLIHFPSELDYAQFSLQDIIEANQWEYLSQENLPKQLVVKDLRTDSSFSLTLGDKDILLPVDQLHHTLLRVLIEPQPILEDTATYDITSWGLSLIYPHIYGITDHLPKGETTPFVIQKDQVRSESLLDKEAYGYIIPPDQKQYYQTIAHCLEAGNKLRVAREAFVLKGTRYPIGTVLALRADHDSNWPASLQGVLPEQSRPVYSGWVDEGPDLGSQSYPLLRKPTIALLRDKSLNANSFGYSWWFLDQNLSAMYHIVQKELFFRHRDQFNVLILPNGHLSFSMEQQDQLKDWVQKGGTLILMEGSISVLPTEDLGLRIKELSEYEKVQAEYADHNPGAVLTLDWDKNHPLGYHMNDSYHTLKTSSLAYEKLKLGENIGCVPEKPIVYGYMGENVKRNIAGSMVFGMVEMGQGEIVLMADDPLYRGFWKSGAQIMWNAIFFVN